MKKRNKMKILFNKFRPVVIIIVAILFVFLLIISKGDVVPINEKYIPPLVEVQNVVNSNFNINLYSQGTVKPVQDIALSSEIIGKVDWVSENFLIGSKFIKNDTLVVFDKRDAELALIIAESNLSQAKLNYEREFAEYELANKEWYEIGSGDGTSLALRKPQFKRAKALLSSSEAAYEQAERNLEKCYIKAPFNGIVKSKYIDVGSITGPGTPLAQIFSIDYVEIELPIDNEEIIFLYKDEVNKNKVILSNNSSGKNIKWIGEITRISEQINDKTRMQSLYAKIDNPYENQNKLKVGLFVKAQLIGKKINNAVKIPRNIIKDDHIWLVNDENKLERKKINIDYYDQDNAVVTNTLIDGQKILITRLSNLIEEMEVRIKD